MTLRHHRSRTATGRALALALTTVGLLTPAAQARWTTPSVLVTGDGAGLLTTTVRSDGTLRAAINDSSRGIGLGLADLAAAGGFGDPLRVLRAPATVSGVALAADGSGVALRAGKASRTLVPFDAAGSAGAPVAFDGVGSFDAVAASPAGSVVTAWVRKSPAGFEVVAAFRDPGSGSFGVPVRAGFTASGDTIVQAGIGDRGEAVVVWQPNGFPSPVAAAVRLPGAGFSKPTFVTRVGSLVELAVGPGGQAILAAPGGRRMRVSVKPAGASTVPPVRTVDRAGGGYGVSVAAAGSDRVAATWDAARTARAPVQVRVYTGTSRTGVHRAGTLGHDAEESRVGLGARGELAVGWGAGLPTLRGDPTARSRFAVTYRRAGGRFEAPQLLGPVVLSATPEALEVAPSGHAYALWEAFESGDSRARPGFRRVYVTRHAP